MSKIESKLRAAEAALRIEEKRRLYAEGEVRRLGALTRCAQGEKERIEMVNASLYSENKRLQLEQAECITILKSCVLVPRTDPTISLLDRAKEAKTEVDRLGQVCSRYHAEEEVLRQECATHQAKNKVWREASEADQTLTQKSRAQVNIQRAISDYLLSKVVESDPVRSELLRRQAEHPAG